MSGNNIPVAILVRVSTIKQETDRQITELQAYADSKGYKVVEILKETISGKADPNERQGLLRCEELARTGQIKKVLTTEISRVARKCSIAHKFVETLEECGVSLYWAAQNIETLMPCGTKRNPAASIILAVMAEISRNELEVLRMRVISGMNQAKLAGKRLGRPVGSTQDRSKKHPDIVKLLKNGHSVRHAAKISGKGFATVQRVKREWLKSNDLGFSGACRN
jgi:DNA invertase Pin-like site-specific DNA recombinase